MDICFGKGTEHCGKRRKYLFRRVVKSRGCVVKRIMPNLTAMKKKACGEEEKTVVASIFSYFKIFLIRVKTNFQFCIIRNLSSVNILNFDIWYAILSSDQGLESVKCFKNISDQCHTAWFVHTDLDLRSPIFL